MSPRRNRPPNSRPPGRGPGRAGDTEPAELDPERLRRGVDAVESWGSERWRVRHITGTGAAKTYRCPGCLHEIRPGTPHVVVWPLDRPGLGEADRRHWHTGCWRARDRRRPLG